MKKIIFLFLLSIIVSIASAQTVENIQVEQDGEKLNINYRIGGSTSEQLYFVTLTCSIDGGPVFEPKSVIGDVGSNIRGGKSFNTVVWSVFKDVDEIGSVEFFVKVDLVSGEVKTQTLNEVPVDKHSITKSKKIDRKIFVGYGGSFGIGYWEKNRLLGIRAGTLGNWGGYGSIRYGYDYEYLVAGASITGGVTKHIFSKDKLRLYAYGGLGLGELLYNFEAEAGLIGVIGNRVNLNIGFAVPTWYADFTFGVGIVF